MNKFALEFLELADFCANAESELQICRCNLKVAFGELSFIKLNEKVYSSETKSLLLSPSSNNRANTKPHTQSIDNGGDLMTIYASTNRKSKCVNRFDQDCYRNEAHIERFVQIEKSKKSNNVAMY